MITAMSNKVTWHDRDHSLKMDYSLAFCHLLDPYLLSKNITSNTYFLLFVSSLTKKLPLNTLPIQFLPFIWTGTSSSPCNVLYLIWSHQEALF